jgi:TRAP-type mannitol/chloroaromatic compound transport system substrate-binding protein
MPVMIGISGCSSIEKIKMKENKRRDFLKKSVKGAALAGTGVLLACTEHEKEVQSGPYINFNDKFRWKMTTTWPPNFPILGEGCKMLADWVKRMSGGRMEITVYGAGELIPPLEGFDAVSNGAVEMNHGAAYYWAGKIPAGQFLSTVPFGMNAQQMDAWILSGGGDKLWEELYAPYDLVPFSAGNTSTQMGGWFNREINSLDDLKGLKMRMPGLGGKVLSKAGGTPLLMSGGEIYTNLERGVIDATEWIGPYHDYLIGFHQIAKYYYYPGWHELGTVLEMIVNKTKFEGLPTDLQEIIRTACLRLNRWMGVEFDTKNGEYLQKIREAEGVEMRLYPKEVLEQLKIYTKEALSELTDRDPASKKIYEAYQAFQAKVRPWMQVSEKVYYGEIL